MSTASSTRPRLWFGPHGRIVAGIFSLAFLSAFESLAVATIMPAVARELDGLALYALAFAAPIAVAVISMTLAGPAMDRDGPGPALRLGVGVFATGLLIAGLAPTMPVFLVGRAVQGFGIGYVAVGLYVVIGRVFAEELRARVFTVMTSAWILPGLVGPLVAGFVADVVGWRWVFLAVPVLAIAALMLIRSGLDGLGRDPSAPVRDRVMHRDRARWALITATGVLAISVAGQRSVPGWPLALLLAVAVTLRYAPRLLPPGTWRGRAGLPSVIATDTMVSAGFFGAEAYLPLSLVENRGLSATHAGLFLTTAAVLWFAGSWMAANVAALQSKPLRVRLGSVAVLVGTASTFLTLGTAVPTALVAIGWGVGGFGMGMAASTLSVLLLDHSGPAEQGSNSAAMRTSESVVQALLLALGSVAFAALLPIDAMTGYVVVLALAATSAAVAVALSARLRDPGL